jgi:hypothetical protein
MAKRRAGFGGRGHEGPLGRRFAEGQVNAPAGRLFLLQAFPLSPALV